MCNKGEAPHTSTDVGTDYMAVMSWRIARMRTGLSAKLLLDELAPELDELAARGAGVAVLPTWVWCTPKTDMGRKGGSLTPVRVEFTPMPAQRLCSRNKPDRQPSASAPARGSMAARLHISSQHGPVVVVAPGEQVQFSWTAEGAGLSLAGTTTVHGRAQLMFGASAEGHRALSTPRRSPTEVPKGVSASFGNVVGDVLRSLVHDGELAEWELRGELAKMVKKYLWQARSLVNAKIDRGEMTIPWQRGPDGDWLDSVGVDTLCDQIIYGNDNLAPDEPSSVGKLLLRCMAPHTFARTDPVHYVAMSLRCITGQAVGRHLGDPVVGPQVRKVADQLGLPRHRAPSPEELQMLLSVYKARHPKDHLGKSRALSALRFRPGWAPHTEMSGAIAADPGVDETAVSFVDVTDTIDDVVGKCREEWGSDLAEVARMWCTAVARGEPDVSKMADELWLDKKALNMQIELVRAVARDIVSSRQKELDPV